VSLGNYDDAVREAAEAADDRTLVVSDTSWKGYEVIPSAVIDGYSTIFADQLRRGRKTATIRVGDKSHKYRKNQAVLVTIGYQYSPREKIFEAVIDAVEVKRVRDLSPRA